MRERALRTDVAHGKRHTAKSSAQGSAPLPAPASPPARCPPQSSHAVRAALRAHVQREVDDGADDHDEAQLEEVLQRAFLQRLAHRLQDIGDDEEFQADEDALAQALADPDERLVEGFGVLWVGGAALKKEGYERGRVVKRDLQGFDGVDGHHRDGDNLEGTAQHGDQALLHRQRLLQQRRGGERLVHALVGGALLLVQRELLRGILPRRRRDDVPSRCRAGRTPGPGPAWAAGCQAGCDGALHWAARRGRRCGRGAGAARNVARLECG
mmetsp:Transcript_36365/g.91832  ORF Transcript_36365/g.91832 Transcript_36365/m.91832 type:complete len:269 (+) Transcript_36365:2366-3172(+)